MFVRLAPQSSHDPCAMRVRLHPQVRDYMDPTSDLAATLCCVDEAHSLEGRNECTDPALAHAEGLRCMHKLHTDPSCAAPTLSAEYKLPIERRHQNLGSDWEWIVKVRARFELFNSLENRTVWGVGMSRVSVLQYCLSRGWTMLSYKALRLDWGMDCRDLCSCWSPRRQRALIALTVVAGYRSSRVVEACRKTCCKP